MNMEVFDVILLSLWCMVNILWTAHTYSQLAHMKRMYDLMRAQNNETTKNLTAIAEEMREYDKHVTTLEMMLPKPAQVMVTGTFANIPPPSICPVCGRIGCRDIHAH